MEVRLDHGKDELDEVHEINVTPFIDVMLVLLIIFMVAAPSRDASSGAVDLASSTAPPRGVRLLQPIFLADQADLRPTLGDDSVPRDMPGETLSRAANGDKNARIFPALRQGGALWRRDGGDEPVARGGLAWSPPWSGLDKIAMMATAFLEWSDLGDAGREAPSWCSVLHAGSPLRSTGRGGILARAASVGHGHGSNTLAACRTAQRDGRGRSTRAPGRRRLEQPPPPPRGEGREEGRGRGRGSARARTPPRGGLAAARASGTTQL